MCERPRKLQAEIFTPPSLQESNGEHKRCVRKPPTETIRRDDNHWLSGLAIGGPNKEYGAAAKN